MKPPAILFLAILLPIAVLASAETEAGVNGTYVQLGCLQCFVSVDWCHHVDTENFLVAFFTCS